MTHQDPSTEPGKQQESDRPMPVIGIGASAGGLEALKQFFSHLPVDTGAALVVITHVSPERKSLLPELLSRVTEIPIVTAEQELQLVPNQIVIAKDSLLEIEDCKLKPLKTDHEPARTYYPIDHFFRSLARDRGPLAIAVVLSGTGSDGTLGAKAIKAAGGFVAAQDPSSAKFSSMPGKVQASGMVDWCQTPEELARTLDGFCRKPLPRTPKASSGLPLPADVVQAILMRLRVQTGQDFTGYKHSTMARRIGRRMQVHQIENPSDYLHYLRKDPLEGQKLLKELLISVTSFFRDPEAFDALSEKGVEDLIRKEQAGNNFRIWVPGCATGEEAYSVAILFREHMRKVDRPVEAQIFATDLDADAIRVARQGVYPETVRADICPKQFTEYFLMEEDTCRVQKTIRDMIVFAVQNVLTDPPFINIDLIVCRNLLIYLDSEVQERALASFHYALRPGGMLFLGRSETASLTPQLFAPVDNSQRLYRRREEERPLPHLLPLSSPPHARVDDSESRSDSTWRTKEAMAHSIQGLLLREFVHCALVVDEQDTVVYSHGHSGRFFQPEQGLLRNKVLDMAREGLQRELARCLWKARKQQEQVLRRNIQVKTNGDRIAADLRVRPIRNIHALKGMMLLTLEPSQQQKLEETEEKAPRRESSGSLQQELDCTREDLQSTVEELQSSNEEVRSSNEELQSINEELQSSNEELETSKEEMQSLNEELRTVNAELETKLEQLSRANDDMNNLLNSVQVAAIFMDTDLRVTRYTEQARSVVRLIETDIGRPLSDLTCDLQYPNLMEDCREVLESLSFKISEIRDSTGTWYLVRLMPYRTCDNVIDGVVLTAVNIDRAKQAEYTHTNVQTNRDFFESIFQTVRDMLLILDNHFRVVLANDAFHRCFRTHADEIENVQLYQLGNGQWDVPELRKLLEHVLPENTMVRGFVIEHEFPWIGFRRFRINARKLQQEDGRPEMVLLAFEDISEECNE